MPNVNYISTPCIAVYIWLVGIRFGLDGVCVGSARLFRYQRVGIINAKCLQYTVLF